MPLEPFDQICPDIARTELHVCGSKVPGLTLGIAASCYE
jgi:hypothetical protein